jgi:ubiquinone/menaquinone biosynthesis C-methylase UbiE
MEAALREMYHVCKPGGCLVMINFNKTPPLRSGLADLAPTVYGVSSWSVDGITAGLHTPGSGGSAQPIRIPID